MTFLQLCPPTHPHTLHIHTTQARSGVLHNTRYRAACACLPACNSRRPSSYTPQPSQMSWPRRRGVEVRCNVMTTVMARRAGAPWLIRNTQNVIVQFSRVEGASTCRHTVFPFISTRTEYLISVRRRGRWEKRLGGGSRCCAGGKLILARDALPYLSQTSATHAN